MRKKWISIICAVIIMVCTIITPAYAAGIFLPEESNTKQAESTDLIEAPSGILMEAQTGTVVYQKDADTRRSPASITKIMTLILIFDALDKGNLKMDDTVTTSAHAKSMGGSQVFLEEGEIQTVETLIKCIVIARDIAIMSRELITKYPKILEYSSIWMENITHVTRLGTKEFGLTNTNKLIRSYEGCVGLKTGSTSIAKYCLSAVAKRNDITLIAVVMAAPDYKVRFKDAASMLNYGFSKCSLYIDKKMEALPEIPVRNGKKKTVSLVYEEQFHYLDTTGQNIGNVKRKLRIHREVKAPVKKNTLAGEMIYSVDGKELGRVRILYGENAGKATYPDCLKKVVMRL